MKDRKIYERTDIKRKTKATLQREQHNKEIKKQVDFESVVEMAGRFHRNNQSGKLTDKDKDKLMMGSKD